MTPERSPMPRQDPRDKDVSDQLPEEQQEGALEGGKSAEDDGGQARAAGEDDSGHRSTPERDTTKSTGNPHAAG